MNRTKPEETKLTICVWHPFTEWRPKPEMAEAIRRRWPEMRAVHLPDYSLLAEELPDTDIFVGYSLRAEQLKDARKLKWIHSTATGIAQLMYPELRDSGVVVTNPRGIFSVPMAEHTMGLLLALARNFPASVRHQDKAHWGQQELWDEPQHLTELNGRVLLIVGFGSIAPETAETKHLFGAEEFARMKPGAAFVNVARGSLVDQDALIRALEAGKLSGAALDVTDPEPLPAESKLWRAPRLFVTPHTSAISDRLWPRQTAVLVGLLEKWFAGEELFNRVDLSRGY
jgi:phosphoglycerate dehydrogenase-like enzyme